MHVCVCATVHRPGIPVVGVKSAVDHSSQPSVIEGHVLSISRSVRDVGTDIEGFILEL